MHFREAKEAWTPTIVPIKSCAQANVEANEAALAVMGDAELGEHLWLLRQLYTRQNEAADRTLRAISRAVSMSERRIRSRG